MNRFSAWDRSRPVAVWLFIVAILVFAMVVVGGITRLTGSGLSITEWKPIMGAIPPMNEADWEAAFALYRQIPQYSEVNAGMSLEEFKGIFWWEWIHRQLGRAIGLVFALPFIVFLLLRLAPARSGWRRAAMPGRLIGRCAILLVLGGLQGLIGWWMVSSGLAERVDVAPERLMVHLGLAFVILSGLVWTGLEAWNGDEHGRAPGGWALAAALLLAGVFFQCLLGALVAGSKAGMIYTDWPLMNGLLVAPIDWGQGALAFLHDQALVQFNHRLVAYGLLIGVSVYAFQTWRALPAEGMGGAAFVLAAGIWIQAVLGVLTLMHAVPLWMGVAHQGLAALVLAAATVNLWLVLRAQPRFGGVARATSLY